MKSWQWDMLILKRIVHTQAFQLLNQPFRLVGQWDDQFFKNCPRKQLCTRYAFLGQTPDEQRETHLKSLQL